MVNRVVLAPEQALYAISHGEFENEIISSQSRVVVIMTQDWCPQWQNMQQWVYELPLEENIDVYELVYNRTSIYHHFMKFKEDVWNNHQIPYLRFYHLGKLAGETNFISRREFEDRLNG